MRATTSSSTPASRPGFNLTSLFLFGTGGEDKNAGVFEPGNGANVIKLFIAAIYYHSMAIPSFCVITLEITVEWQYEEHVLFVSNQIYY